MGSIQIEFGIFLLVRAKWRLFFHSIAPCDRIQTHLIWLTYFFLRRFVFVTLILIIASTVCIRFRNILRKYEQKEGGDFNQPNTPAPRNILLY